MNGQWGRDTGVTGTVRSYYMYIVLSPCRPQTAGWRIICVSMHVFEAVRKRA